MQESSSILKTFSVDVNQKPELSVYLDTLFMQMQHSPRYFPDGNIKYNYSSKLKIPASIYSLITAKAKGFVV